MQKKLQHKQYKTNQLKVYISDNLLQLLETHCKENETNKSSLFRELLTAYLT